MFPLRLSTLLAGVPDFASAKAEKEPRRSIKLKAALINVGRVRHVLFPVVVVGEAIEFEEGVWVIEEIGRSLQERVENNRDGDGKRDTS